MELPTLFLFLRFKNQEFVLEMIAPFLARIPCFLIIILGLVSEEIEFFVLASLAMKLCEYTRNTPIRRNPVSKF